MDEKQRERRERIAMAALVGIMANQSIWEGLKVGEEEALAVKLADRLIAELDKEPSR